MPITANSRYHKGRQYLTNHDKRAPLQEPQVCACGCGQQTTIYQGRVRKFINGHNSTGMKRGEGRYVHRQGYVMLRMPEHPDAVKYGGYVLEHRYVMEQHVGRPLRPKEHVHHLDHDRTNNAIENLLIVDPIEHAKYHTSQPRIHQSEEHRRKTAEAMKRVWAERKRQVTDPAS